MVVIVGDELPRSSCPHILDSIKVTTTVVFRSGGVSMTYFFPPMAFKTIVARPLCLLDSFTFYGEYKGFAS